MPMPTLDPSRYVDVVLADPSHKLPMPDRGGRLFRPEGETVDTHDPFWMALLADKSIARVPQPDEVADAATSADAAPSAEDAGTPVTSVAVDAPAPAAS